MLRVVSPSPTPPLQSSIPVTPQSVSIFKPPYPANFFSIWPLLSSNSCVSNAPIFKPQWFPQQSSAGNKYLPAAVGIKFPIPSIKGYNKHNKDSSYWNSF